MRGAADAAAAGSFPAFAFYSQTAHLCLFDVTHTYTHTYRRREGDIEPSRSVQPLSLCDSYIISQDSGAILLLSVSVYCLSNSHTGL